MKMVIFLLALLALAAVSNAASFNCDKAGSSVEKTICADAALSQLDDLMAQSYKKALASAARKDAVKSQQVAWITKERNVCKDAACIEQAYKKRLAALDSPAVDKNAAPNGSASALVLGRCHMNTCWWWKIEKTEVVKAEEKGKLVKVSTTSTSVDYTDAAIRKHGYPKNPPKNCQWEEASEAYLFCSSKLPTYIEFSQDKNTYVGTVPFTDADGNTAGATEGIGNLYLHVCNGGKKTHFALNPEALEGEITLKAPTDIFNH